MAKFTSRTRYFASVSEAVAYFFRKGYDTKVSMTNNGVSRELVRYDGDAKVGHVIVTKTGFLSATARELIRV